MKENKWLLPTILMFAICVGAIIVLSIKVYDDKKDYIELNKTISYERTHNLSLYDPETCSLGLHGNATITPLSFYLLSDQGCDFLEYSCNNSIERYAINCSWHDDFERCDCYTK